MKQIIFTILCLTLFIPKIKAQNEIMTISGYVRDSSNKAPLVNAYIVLDFDKSKGTFTNKEGFYNLFLPRNKYVISVRHVGYRPTRLTLNLRKDTELNFMLNPLANELEEVIVSGKSSADANIERPLLGVSSLNIKTLQKIPSAFGELDILKGLQMLPGVTSVGEASNGVNIRGGATDQNLILLEDAPIFNPTHMFGLFSVFPTDAVSGLDLYKGNVPARYGGRAAAVMSVSLVQPNLDKTTLTGGISLVSNRLTLNTPLIKEKMGIVISGRGAFNDFLLPLVSDKLDNIKANFGDFTTKLFYKINPKNTLTATMYLSSDFFQTDLLGTIQNVNATATQFKTNTTNFSAKWFHAVNDRLNFQTSYISASYTPKFQLPELNSTNKVELLSGINYQQIKANANYYLLKQKLEMGIEGTKYDINPGELKPNESKSVLAIKTPIEQALEVGIYVEDEVTFSKKITASFGIRYSLFSAIGPHTVRRYKEGEQRDDFSVIDSVQYSSGQSIKQYGGFEPRFGLKYSLSENTSLKIGYTLMRQYVQTVTNTTTPLPTARWKTSDDFIKPQVSQLISAGWFHNSKNNVYEFSLEGYYRHTDHIIDYKPGADFVLQKYPETQLLQGQNRSYGLEMMLSKKKGEATGWLSYTYSRSENQVNEGANYRQQVNFGNWYSSNYDRPHMLNASLVVNAGKNNDFSFNFSYSTGRPYTTPKGFVGYNGAIYPFYDLRNNDRIPDYHRLDFAWNIYQPSMKNKKWKGSWTFTVFNIYGRSNAYSVFFRTESRVIKPYQLTIFGSPIPTLSYNFKY